MTGVRRPGNMSGSRVVGDARPPVYFGARKAAEEASWSAPVVEKELDILHCPVDEFVAWLAKQDERRLAGQ